MLALRIASIALAAALSATACGGSSGAPDAAERAVPMEMQTGEAAGGDDQVPFSDRSVGKFENKRAMRHVRRLAGRIGIRVRTTRNEGRGARYIAKVLSSYGYTTRINKFEVAGEGTSRNVVAKWPGAQKYGVIIGAHMDTVSGAPGANDNASGTAAMLEVARLIAGNHQSKFIRFVAFGSEEYGSNGEHHLGSEVFVRRLKRKGRNRLAGMVSVDMVADGKPLIVGNSDIASDVVANTVYNKIRKAGIAVTFRTLCDCSDHGPFERAGIPASFMWSGDEPNYHSPSDTVANMKRKHLRRSGRALKAFVKEIKPAMLKRFRRSR